MDSGAQCSSITLGVVKESKLDLHPLDTLQLRGWGGVEVGYLGYTECTLEIPKVKGFKQDVLLLVVNNSEYEVRVPILLGTLHINMILEEGTLEEIKNLPAAWKRGSVGSMVLTKEAQLDQGQEILNLTAKVRLSKNLTIPGLQVQKVLGLVNIPNHVKRVNVTTEAILGNIENRGIEAGDAYATLNGGSNRVALVVRNVMRNKITLKRGMVIPTVSAANVVPPMLAPQPSTILDIPENVPKEKGTDNILGNTGMYSCQLNGENSNRPLISDERSNKLFGKLNLEGLNDWP